MDKAEQIFEKQAITGPLLDIAGLGMPSLAGYFIGRNRGKQVGETGKGQSSTVGAVARMLFIPGAMGYEYGKRRARKDYEGLKKKGEYQMSKAEAVFDKIAAKKKYLSDKYRGGGYNTKKAEYVFATMMEKDAQAGAILKGLWGAAKSGVKGYGKNIAHDFKNVISGGKAIKSFGKGEMTAGKMLAKRKTALKSMAGLGGRVGLPGVIGYNMLTD